MILVIVLSLGKYEESRLVELVRRGLMVVGVVGVVGVVEPSGVLMVAIGVVEVTRTELLAVIGRDVVEKWPIVSRLKVDDSGGEGGALIVPALDAMR